MNRFISLLFILMTACWSPEHRDIPDKAECIPQKVSIPEQVCPESTPRDDNLNQVIDSLKREAELYREQRDEYVDQLQKNECNCYCD